jgi:hypothetical protein
METKKRRIDPEEMKNATLSDGAKNYLVAFRMAEEAVEVVTNQMETFWGTDNVELLTVGLTDKLEELREEIIRVMMLQVRENLWSANRTAI